MSWYKSNIISHAVLCFISSCSAVIATYTWRYTIGELDWTCGLDYWTDRFSSEHAGMLHNVPKHHSNSLTLTLALVDLDSVSISPLI